MVKIKICGLKRLEDIEYVNKYMPDFIGFIFAKSKRQVSYEKAKSLKQNLLPNIKAVGVFVNESIENILNLCNNKIIDIIQLHGDEDESYILNLKKQTTTPIIKAIRVKDENDILKNENLGADYFLFDTYSDKMYGGCGESFDHNIIPKTFKKPYFLAGGINKDNIENALKLKPYCIDVNSGVEIDGFKDEIKIKNIIEIVRSKINE